MNLIKILKSSFSVINMVILKITVLKNGLLKILTGFYTYWI